MAARYVSKIKRLRYGQDLFFNNLNIKKITAKERLRKNFKIWYLAFSLYFCQRLGHCCFQKF